MPSDFNEAASLQYDPFAGDDGESNVLADQIVTTRKAAECHQCGEMTVPGDRTRSRREVFEGEFMTFRWCGTCTRLMAADSDDAFDARFRVRIDAPPTEQNTIDWAKEQMP